MRKLTTAEVSIAGNAPEVDDEIAHRPLARLLQALHYLFAKPVGCAEEHETLQAIDENGGAVFLEKLAALLGAVHIGMEFGAGKRVLDDIDFAVVDHEQEQAGDNAEQNSRQQPNEHDDHQDCADDSVFGRQ